VVLQESDQGLREVTGTGSGAPDDFAGKPDRRARGKSLSRQDYEKDKFEKDNREKYLHGKKLLRMHSLFWPLSDIACGLQMLGGFIFAAILAIRGEITVGTYPA
jgi:hypothetical protein